MADPGVRLRVEAIVLWTKLARKLPEPKRASLSRAWSRALAAFRKLDGKSPWKLVKGPMAATIATLLDTGWGRCNPTLWKDERGDEWDISRKDVSYGELRARVGEAAMTFYWKKAVTSRHGQDLAAGADLTVANRLMREFRRHKQPTPHRRHATPRRRSPAV